MSLLDAACTYYQIHLVHAVILKEGQTLSKVGIIQEGRCLANAQVPDTPTTAEVSLYTCSIASSNSHKGSHVEKACGDHWSVVAWCMALGV